LSDLKFTGERLVPDISPPQLEAEHRARYEMARDYIAGGRVLDLGCGTGYGSGILLEKAMEVVGIDLSDEAIEYANEKYKSQGLEFLAGDVTNLQFENDSFDAVVCFEVVEHIENAGTLLDEVSRVIKDEGLFIVSTPNGAVIVSSRPNPYHFREYNVGEFTKLLESRFPPERWKIELFGQFIKGKNYSSISVLAKNLYLSIKGLVGLHGKLDFTLRGKTDSAGRAEMKYEFKADRAELAEYLVAIISPRE